jgi:P pilus assembly chaperone PapD
MFKTTHYILAGLIAAIYLATTAPAFAAHGDLTVTPTRIVFGERDRSAQVHLINRGETRATFRIEFVQMRMDEKGEMSEIETPNDKERFADALVRYSPRQVELDPGQSQAVRLLLRKPEDLAAGEYRSHLLFYALPVASGAADVERTRSQSSKGFSVAIQAIYRMSLPVIVRHGDLPVRFSMHDLTLTAPEKSDGKPQLKLRVQRDGHRSVYGDVNVYFQPNNGERVLLKHIKDFVLYTSTDSRILSIPIDTPKGLRLSAGTMHAIYSENVDGTQNLLAEQRIALP